MNKKTILILASLIIIIVLIIIILPIKSTNKDTKTNSKDIVSKYDEETAEYVITNEKDGKVLYTTKYEEDIEEWEEFYKNNPDFEFTYESSNPDSDTLDSEEMLIYSEDLTN